MPRIIEKSRIDKTYGAETDENFFRIWENPPGYQDHISRISIFKGLFLIVLSSSLIFFTAIVSKSYFTSFGVGILILVILVFFFQDNFFKLKNFTLYNFRRFGEFNPFDDFIFYFKRDDINTIFFSNKNDLINGALRFFIIRDMPSGINPAINKFIQAIYNRKISLTYQVIHRPTYGNCNNSYKIDVIFCIFSKSVGILNNHKLKRLQDDLHKYSEDIRIQFTSFFHHFNVELLEQDEILQVIRYFATGIKSSSIAVDREEKFIDISKINATLLLRLFSIIFIIVYTIIILVIINWPMLIIVIIVVAQVIGLLFIWWREALFQLSLLNLRKNQSCQLIDPFRDITFHYHRDFPDCLFAHINSKMLVAVKPFNLAFASPDLYTYETNNDKYIKMRNYNLDEFYGSILGTKKGVEPITFSNSIIIEPMNYHNFEKEGFRFLKDKAKAWIDKDFTEKRGVDWLNRRTGIWKTSINLSAFAHVYTDRPKISKIKQVGDLVRTNAYLLNSAYSSNFTDFRLTELKNNKMISGVLCNVLKNREFRLNGTQLNCILFQGISLQRIMQVSQHFSSGIPITIPAEFQSPKHLENDIIIGRVFDMETEREEIKAGIDVKKSKNILITNGLAKNREALIMKIVSKLIEKDTSSLIFDITGNWSKIISEFKDTIFEDRILHFRLGSTLTIDPLHSGIEFDKNNPEYLEYIVDSYSFAFKKSRYDIENFRSMIKAPEIEISQLNLDLKNKFDRSARSGNIFADFTKLKENYFHSSSDNLQDKIDILQFIQDYNTVIFDLSKVNDSEEQLFLAFIILSKYIHFAEKNDIVRKFIVLSNPELFFNNNFISRNYLEGKVDKFLDPLINHGFGLIFSVDQLNKLHSKVLNNFNTTIAFRTENFDDINILKNKLNLEDDIKGGQYSKSRKSKHHIEYLRSNMGIPNVGLPIMSMPFIKRVDLDYPFVISVGDKFLHKPMMDYEEIIDFMHKQGYDLKGQRQLIESHTQESTVKKDFGMYAEFFPQIKKCLEGLRKVDGVAINKRKIDEALSEALKKGAIKYTQNRKDKKLMRKEIFNILVKHGYLKTETRNNAGGSESLAESYHVGRQFDKAVNEVFEYEGNTIFDAEMETLEKETDEYESFEDIFQNEDVVIPFDLEAPELKGILKDVYADSLYEFFELYQCLNKKKDYKRALEYEKIILESILKKGYKKKHGANITDELMNEVINNILQKVDTITSFREKNFIYYLKKSRDTENGNSLNLEDNSKEIDKYLSYIFNPIKDGVAII